MSRLIDELNRVAKATPEPMGFRAARPTSIKLRMLLIASLANIKDTNHLTDVVGADAVLLRLPKSALAAKTLPKIVESVPAVPWGGWLEDTDLKEIEPLIEAGCDFIVFPAASRIFTIPQDVKAGKILQIEPSLSDGLVRAVNDLPVDAVLAVNAYETDGSMAWHHLMHFQRLANLLDKPLLVSTPVNVTADELKVLWEVGVDGVVVDADIGQPTGRLRELHRSIGELAFPPSRKRRKAEAMLPRPGADIGTADEEEEEEYE